MKYLSIVSYLIVICLPVLNGQVQINIDGGQKRHTISPMIQGFGLIYSLEADSIYEDGEMTQLFKDVGAGFLRYPGGAVTTMYHWNDLNGQGWIDSWNGTYDRANDAPPENYMDLDEYMALCEAADAEPMLGINMSSGRNYDRQKDGLNEAVALLKYCNENNYDVKYLYLDNENHHKKWSPEEYGAQINYYVDSIKKYAPETELIGNWTDKFRSNRSSYRILLDLAGEHLDYMDVHWYWKWGVARWEEWIAKTPMENETEWYNGASFAEEIEYFNDLVAEMGKPHIKLAVMEWNIPPGPHNTDPAQTPFRTALMQSELQMQMMQGGLEIGSLWSTQWPNDSESEFQFLVSSDNNYMPGPTAKPFELYKNALNGDMVESNASDGKILVTTVIKDDNRAFVYILNKNIEYTALNINMSAYDIISVKQALCFKEPGNLETISVEENNTSYSTVIPGYSLTMVEFEVDISNHIFEADLNQQKPIYIWPNPASENVQIKSDRLEGAGSVRLYNSLGIMLVNKAIEYRERVCITLPVKHLPAGSYFVVLSDESGNQCTGNLMVE